MLLVSSCFDRSGYLGRVPVHDTYEFMICVHISSWYSWVPISNKIRLLITQEGRNIYIHTISSWYHKPDLINQIKLLIMLRLRFSIHSGTNRWIDTDKNKCRKYKAITIMRGKSPPSDMETSKNWISWGLSWTFGGHLNLGLTMGTW